MADIIDSGEVDKDTVSEDILEKQFSTQYELITETSVSVKKTFINNLHGSKSLKLAVSLSDNSIEVYELSSTSLNKVCRLSGHGKVVSDVVFNPKDANLVYSSGQDGVVKLWDTRASGTCVQEYKDEDDNQLKPYDCMDVSCNGRVLCAGSQLVQDDAFLVFWDQRQLKPLGGYWNSHTDDITQVRFHPQKPELLATGALDGLLNIFNIAEQTEDDALTYSLNVENSIEKLSWLDDHQVACTSQSHDLQVWDADSGDLIRSYSRENVAKGIRRSKPDDVYLVDTYTSRDGAHCLLAGSYDGKGDCLRSVQIGDKKLRPSANFALNKQIVSGCWHHRERDILVTAGESGLISVWRCAGAGGAGEGARVAGGEGEGGKLATKMNKLHVKRHKPY